MVEFCVKSNKENADNGSIHRQFELGLHGQCTAVSVRKPATVFPRCFHLVLAQPNCITCEFAMICDFFPTDIEIGQPVVPKGSFWRRSLTGKVVLRCAEAISCKLPLFDSLRIAKRPEKSRFQEYLFDVVGELLCFE